MLKAGASVPPEATAPPMTVDPHTFGIRNTASTQSPFQGNDRDHRHFAGAPLGVVDVPN